MITWPGCTWREGLTRITNDPVSLNTRRDPGTGLENRKHESTQPRGIAAASWIGDVAWEVCAGCGPVANLGAAEVASLYGVSESGINELAEEAVGRALHVWETPALRFDPYPPGLAVEGPSRGAEIDLFAGRYPVQFFGFTDVEELDADERLLTNGQRIPGFVIVGTDIFINTNRILESVRMLHQFGIRLELLQATVDEITLGVNIVLGEEASTSCPAFDIDHDGFVRVDELIAAIGAALNGCAAAA